MTRRSRTAAGTFLGLAAGLLLLTGLPGVPAAADEEPTPERRALQERINDAIDRGVAWLVAHQREDGTFPLAPKTDGSLGDPSTQWAGGPWDVGLNALCVYALAVCDVPVDDPALVKGFAHLKKLWAGRAPPRTRVGPSSQDGVTTYFVSLCLLALDAAHNRGAAPLSKGPPDPRKTGKKLIGTENLAWAEELVAWLEAAQDPGVGKTPVRRRRGRKPKPRAPSARSEPTRDDGGGFGYESPCETTGYHDHSNSQFAVLGLKSASRLGVDVSEVAYIRALRHFLAVQEEEGPEIERVDAPDAADPKAGLAPGESRTTDEPATPKKDEARGWGYMCPNSTRAGPGVLPPDGKLPPIPLPGLPPGGEVKPLGGILDEATPAMTAGGVSTLVICRSELEGVRGFTKDLRRLSVTGIRDGFAWLARCLRDLEEKPAAPPPGLPPGVQLPPGFPEVGDTLDDFYFLYGLERACILGGVKAIGGLDWYAMGAVRILDRQREDGSFQAKEGSNANGRPEIDSCFALLFLKRAVFRVPDRRVVTAGD